MRSSIAYNSAFQLLKIVVPLITIPYLSRTLGAEGVGVYSYTYTVANYFVLFGALGMATYGVREIAIVRHDRSRRSFVFWNILASQMIVGALVVGLYFVYLGTLAGGYTFEMALWIPWVVSSMLDVSWLMFGMEDFKRTAIRSIVLKVLELAAIVVFVKTPDDVWVYILIISLEMLVSQLLLWPFVMDHVDFCKPTWRVVVSHFLPNARLFVPVIAISLYTTIDRLMLGLMSSMTQVGYFDYSEKICKIPMALITAVGTVMLPHVSHMVERGRFDEMKRLLGRSMWAMQIGAVGLAAGIVAVAPEFVPFFFGPDYSSCIELVAALAIIIPIITFTNVVGKQYLLPTFKDSVYIASVCAGAVVSVASNLVLIPRFGAMGAAASTILAESTVLLAQSVYARKRLPVVRYALAVVPYAICGMAMVVVVRNCADALQGVFTSSVLCLMCEIAIGAGVYVLAGTVVSLFLFRPWVKDLVGRRRAG